MSIKEETLNTVLGVSLSRTSLGVTHQLSGNEKLELLQNDVIDSGASTLVSVSRHLIPPKHPDWRQLTKACSRVRRTWVENALPWVKPGIRILKKSNYEKFLSEYQDAYDAFLPVRKMFCEEAWPTIVADAKKRWGSRFNPSLYPTELPLSTFDFALDYPSLDANDSLEALDPAAYKKMKALATARLEEACQAAEKAFAAGLQDFLSRLQENLTPTLDESGTPVPKRLPTKTLNALQSFYEDFKALTITDHHELNALFEKALTLATSTDFKSLKDSAASCESFKASLSELASTIHVVTGAPAGRKITPKKKDSPPECQNSSSSLMPAAIAS